LVIAVGADPARPATPGMEEAGTVWAGDVCAGDAETGERVVVAGGGGIGCETALHLARLGKKVTVVEMLAEAACDFNFINRGMLLEMMAEAGVELRTGLTVVEIRADGVTTVDGAGGRGDITADTVVLALGMAPRSVLVEELKPAAPRVFVVGDCVRPRHILDAVHEGFYSVVEL
jgi:2-enoate reductase